MKEIAIIIATYNGEKYINELLESLVNQTYQNFRCYIHDDGSSDQTLEICLRYQEAYPENFLVLNYPASGGSKENFFSIIKYVVEPYMMFCDQDDIWLPKKIELSLKKIKELEFSYNSKPLIVFSDLKIVDSNLNVLHNSYCNFKKVRKNISFRDSLIQGIIPGCACILNRKLYSILNTYKNVNNIYMHDWWALALCLGVGGHYDIVEEPLILYRQHSNNTLGVKKANFFTAVRHVIKEYLTGELKAKKAEWVMRSINISKELLNIKNLRPEYRKLCSRIVNIREKNKLYRIKFYYCNFRKTKNLIYMLIWV